MKPRRVAVGIVLCGLAGVAYLAAQPLKRSAQTSSCQSNLRQIGNSMMQYQRDYDEKFPQSENWMDMLMPYARGFGRNPESVAAVKKRFACPTTGSFYAYNSLLSGQSVSDISPNALWFFEVSAGADKYNLSDDGSLWPSAPIHQTKTARGSNVYIDVYSSPAKIALLQNKPNFDPFLTSAPGLKSRVQTKENQ